MQAFLPTSSGVRNGSGVASRNAAASLPQLSRRAVQSRSRLVINAAHGHGGPPVAKGAPKSKFY
jgi:hypothetical protein